MSYDGRAEHPGRAERCHGARSRTHKVGRRRLFARHINAGGDAHRRTGASANGGTSGSTAGEAGDTAGDTGGDIYGAVLAADGTRVLVGDVMGKGAAAEGVAGRMLLAWQTMAPHEPTLTGLALRLHSLIACSAQPDRFVTAVLATIHPRGGLELLCCGHPPPLLMRGGAVTYADAHPHAPPLGMLELAGGWCRSVTTFFGGDDRLLLYTDGVSEARDPAGRDFPLADRTAALRAAGPERLLDGLECGLRRHCSGPPADDALLVLVDRAG